VFRRCGCTVPVTGRQYGTRCPRLAAGGRHGSWYVRLELPGGPGGPGGRRRRIRRGGYPSRKAAVEVLGRLRNPKAGGTGGVVPRNVARLADRSFHPSPCAWSGTRRSRARVLGLIPTRVATEAPGRHCGHHPSRPPADLRQNHSRTTHPAHRRSHLPHRHHEVESPAITQLRKLKSSAVEPWLIEVNCSILRER
jgi:hypothetical protein